jgi:hypothetical protein
VLIDAEGADRRAGAGPQLAPRHEAFTPGDAQLANSSNEKNAATTASVRMGILLDVRMAV